MVAVDDDDGQARRRLGLGHGGPDEGVDVAHARIHSGCGLSRSQRQKDGQGRRADQDGSHEVSLDYGRLRCVAANGALCPWVERVGDKRSRLKPSS